MKLKIQLVAGAAGQLLISDFLSAVYTGYTGLSAIFFYAT